MTEQPKTILPGAALANMIRLATEAPPGCFVEVGVYRGGSAWHLAQIAAKQGRALHLFDTFTGIPCKSPLDSHKIGDFDDTDLEEVRRAIPDAVFHVGVFPDTMPADLPPIGFAHIDCDQYESVSACIEHLYPKLVDGGIMLFDDYEHLPGAAAAVEERFGRQDIRKTPDGKYYVAKNMTFTHRFNTWQRNPDGRKRCLVMRWGAIGDMLVAGSVCAGLKAQGYHVTMNTNATGADILANNPSIDEFMVIDNETVKTAEYQESFGRIGERYDKVINLDYSLEGLLLAREENHSYRYPHAARRYLFDKNYLEAAHLIAGVEPDFGPVFFPTTDELEWAEGGRRSLTDPCVLWAISGSSVNKVYPWVNVVSGWLAAANVNVVFTGGNGPAETLEAAIIQTMADDGADMSMIYPRVGAWSLRQALTFAQHATDVVVGPETGLLHGPAFWHVPKVVYLSHSSHENLTKHWENTRVLTPAPELCPCYPCHQIHKGWDSCVMNEATNAAQCASSIAPEAVMEAIMTFIARPSN